MQSLTLPANQPFMSLLGSRLIMDDEKVDILQPPTFKKTGEIKTRDQALDDGDWIGTFNLWVVRTHPQGAILYQQRSPDSSWEPNKLDVSVGGHLTAGETKLDGLREAEEELGKHYDPKSLISTGRKIHVGPDTKGREHHNIIDIYLVTDNSPLKSFQLQQEEVFAICDCPVNELIKVHMQKGYSFTAKAMRNDNTEFEIKVTKNSFPYNWDNYHYKMAVLVKRFLEGKKNLIY